MSSRSHRDTSREREPRGGFQRGSRPSRRRGESHSHSRSPPRRDTRSDRHGLQDGRGHDRRRDDRDSERRNSTYDRPRDHDRRARSRDKEREKPRDDRPYNNDARSDRVHDAAVNSERDQAPTGASSRQLDASGRVAQGTIPTNKVMGRPKASDFDDLPMSPDKDVDLAADDDNDQDMMAMMGFDGFGSSKGKHVEGNQEGGVNIKKMRTWRQYMNRRGGFNRPLDKIK